MDTVNKTLDILEAFLKQQGEIGIAELSDSCGVNITTTHRIVSDLVKRGYLKQRQKRGKYSIGTKPLEFYGIIQNSLKIGEIALPHLQKLSSLSGEYCEVAILEAYSAMTVVQVETTHNLKIRNEIGERLPLHATSLGKLFLSYMTSEERKYFYNNRKLLPYSPHTLVDPGKLEQEIKSILQQGFALDNEEFDTGIWAVAAPVFGSDHSLAGGLAIAAPSVRIDSAKSQELVGMAVNSALDISRELGYKG